MTAYFDEMMERIANVPLDDFGEASESLAAIESVLVNDVSVCSMLPGFPAQYVVRLHRIINAWSFATRDDRLPSFEPQDVKDAANRLMKLARELHTLFHDVASVGAFAFTDDPRSGLRQVAKSAAEIRLAVWRMFGEQGSIDCPCKCGHPLEISSYRRTVQLRTSPLYDGIFVEVDGWAAVCPVPGCCQALTFGVEKQDRAMRYEALLTLLSKPGAPQACLFLVRTEFLRLTLDRAAERLGTTAESLLAVEDAPYRLPMDEALREALLDAMMQVKV